MQYSNLPMHSKRPNNQNPEPLYTKITDPETNVEIFEVPNPVIEQNTSYFNPADWALENFEIGRFLGSGTYGNIYLAREKVHRYIVVLKVQYLDHLKEEEMLPYVAREIELQTQLNHPNIVRMFGYFTNSTMIVQILEFAPGGELFQKLHVDGRFSEKKSARYIYQFLLALKYLHGHQNIIHRDIKPENILLDQYDNIKLADFGFAIKLKSGEKRESKVGTPDYMCPEVTRRRSYSFGADVWSVGVLAFELNAGHAPYNNGKMNQKQIAINVVKNKYEFPEFFSSDLKAFIKGILRTEADKRMTLDQALIHPWITKNYDPKKDPLSQQP